MNKQTTANIRLPPPPPIPDRSRSRYKTSNNSNIDSDFELAIKNSIITSQEEARIRRISELSQTPFSLILGTNVAESNNRRVLSPSSLMPHNKLMTTSKSESDLNSMKDLIEFPDTKNTIVSDDNFDGDNINAFDPLFNNTTKNYKRNIPKTPPIPILTKPKSNFLRVSSPTFSHSFPKLVENKSNELIRFSPDLMDIGYDFSIEMLDPLNNPNDTFFEPCPLRPKKQDKKDFNKGRKSTGQLEYNRIFTLYNSNDSTIMKGRALSTIDKSALVENERELLEHFENKHKANILENFESCSSMLYLTIKRIKSECIQLGKSKLTQLGLLISPYRSKNWKENDISVKITILSEFCEDGRIVFTPKLTDSIYEIMKHVISKLSDICDEIIEQYLLQVNDKFEYLPGDKSLQLGQFDYVQDCETYNKDIIFRLVKIVDIHSELKYQDDGDEIRYKLKTNIENKNEIIYKVSSLNEINEILKKMFKLIEDLKLCAEKNTNHILDDKILKSIISCLETLKNSLFRVIYLNKINELIERLIFYLNTPLTNDRIVIFKSFLKNMTKVVKDYIMLYSQVCVTNWKFCHDIERRREHTLPGCNLFIHINSAYFVAHEKKNMLAPCESYAIRCGLYYGGKRLTEKSFTTEYVDQLRTFVSWNKPFEFEYPIEKLPRETRLYVLLLGIQNGTVKKLAAGNIQIFDHEYKLRQGPYIHGLWKTDLSKYDFMTSTSSNVSTLEMKNLPNQQITSFNSVLLEIQFKEFDEDFIFPEFYQENSYIFEPAEFKLLNPEVQKSIDKIIKKTPSINLGFNSEEKNILWKNRRYLHNISSALPLVLLACPSWTFKDLPEIYSMLEKWKKPSCYQVVQLLLPNFPDARVRGFAIKLLSELTCDELRILLPQLVQAIQFESYHHSELVELLLKNSIFSIRFAHDFYWLLKECNEGDPQHFGRYVILMEALFNITSDGFLKLLRNQENFCKYLATVALKVKKPKDDKVKLRVLRDELLQFHDRIDDLTCIHLPLNASLRINNFITEECDFFHSKTFPIKLVLNNIDLTDSQINIIFKDGDDLRQDAFVMQLINIMDQIWRDAGLDFPLVRFQCQPTAKKKGLIEFITGSETLATIHKNDSGAISGVLNKTSIFNWLKQQHDSMFTFRQARTNFTKSCAAYCVAMYVLGVGDRHNDNIMIKKSGQMFHIDFGKYLGETEKFLNQIDRDRTPFILTEEMVYVINGSDTNTIHFREFIQYSCDAFNVLRQQQSLLLSVFALMSKSGLLNINEHAVKFIYNQLNMFGDLLIKNDAEGMDCFTKLIYQSLGDTFVKTNFIVHNLANPNRSIENKLFKFQPQTYTKDTDGRIVNVEYEKTTDDREMFLMIVNRENFVMPSVVYRTLAECKALRDRLAQWSQLYAKFEDFNNNQLFGRRTKIMHDDERILKNLLKMIFSDRSAAETDIIHTFFHSTLRDENFNTGDTTYSLPQRNFGESGIIGSIWFTMWHEDGILKILIRHADLNYGKQFPTSGNGQVRNSVVFNSYVKVKILPDEKNETKRKTRVLKNTQYPTYNELIQYIKSKEELNSKVLYVGVWDDQFVQRHCIGCMQISLQKNSLSNSYGDAIRYPLQPFIN